MVNRLSIVAFASFAAARGPRAAKDVRPAASPHCVLFNLVVAKKSLCVFVVLCASVLIFWSYPFSLFVTNSTKPMAVNNTK